MSLNLDNSKRDHDSFFYFFFSKRATIFHPSLTFNVISVARTCFQKHLRMVLDNNLKNILIQL